MLRALVLVLLLANLLFLAWTQGWLDRVVGARARGDREPERLARQVYPETIRVVPPGAPASAAASAPPVRAATYACLEAGPFRDAGASAAATALRALDPPLPEGSWSDDMSVPAGRWLVFMGRFPGTEARARKEEELKRRSVDYEEVELVGLTPGLSLGRFETRAAADETLASLSRQGIRTARVVETPAAAPVHLLRAARADDALAERLRGLRGEAWGKGFTACAKAPSGA